MSADGVTSAVPDRDTYFTSWSALHGGYDPRGSRLVGPWLSLTYLAARPFAALRVPPDVVTLLGLLVSGAVAALAPLGGRWLLLAALVTVLSGFTDNLDGAVAVLTDRATRWGYVLDSVVDRVSDGLYLLALWLVGAPAGVCVGAGAVMVLQEYARARAGAAGMAEVGVVTVWERPSRIIVTAMFLVGAGIYDSASENWATAGALAWLTLGVVGLAQLLVVVRRRLTAPE
ncbi:MAG: CDP-alcohol phosphatidyltransferase family protein [Motilibacteraceae bacterium]